MNTYDSAFATTIGGYPTGAFLLGDDLKTVFRCTSDGNTANPNAVITGWARQADDISSILQLDSAATRNVGTGTSQIPDMSSFTFSGTGTDNTLIKLPNGVIFQTFKEGYSKFYSCRSSDFSKRCSSCSIP